MSRWTANPPKAQLMAAVREDLPADILDDGTAIGGAVADVVRLTVLPVTYETLPARSIVPHRGAGAMLVPENTMAAIAFGEALGFEGIDGGDYHMTRDGACVAVHDATLDRTTTLTGNVNAYPLSALKQAPIIDAGAWFGGQWGNHYVHTFEEVLDRFAGRVRITFEPKDAATAAYFAKVIAARKLGKNIEVNGASIDLVQPSVAAGATGKIGATVAQMTSITPATLIAQMQAAGIGALSVQHGADMTKVQQFIDAGIRVDVYGVLRQAEYALWNGKSVASFSMDDPLYTPSVPAKYRTSSIDWVKTGTYPPGHFHWGNAVGPAGRGTFVSDGAGGYRLKFTQDSWCLLGSLSPVPSPIGPYTITVPMRWSTVGGDTTRWVGLFICAPDDGSYHNVAAANENGYLLFLRANGQISLSKRTAGAAGTAVTQSTTAITAGTDTTLTITVSPTTISVQRDGGTALVLTDSSFRGGYMHFGVESAGTNNIGVEWGALAVA